MKLTVSQCKIESGFLNGSWRQVRNCQILQTQETVVLVVVRCSRRQKARKQKLVKQCGRQAGKIKALRFEMFLKRRHSAPVFHYAVNFIRRGRSGKFKAWFHGKKALELEIPKPQTPCWPYRHFKECQKWKECQKYRNDHVWGPWVLRVSLYDSLNFRKI